MAALRGFLLSATLGGAAAWQTDGRLSTSSDFITYAGKFCFDYRPERIVVDADGTKRVSKIVAGILDIRIHGLLREVPAEYFQGKHKCRALPGRGPCHTPGKMWLMAFDDEEEH